LLKFGRVVSEIYERTDE